MKLLSKVETKKGYVLIGKITGAHGLKGTNKLHSYAESLSVFKPGGSILIRDHLGRETVYEINGVTPHPRTPLIALKGVHSRAEAEALAGAELFIEKSELPELDEGTHYWVDLIGMAVYTTDETYLGRIESIIATGSNDVYVVHNGQTEVLVPALESVVVEIDTERNCMRVELPEGLI